MTIRFPPTITVATDPKRRVPAHVDGKGYGVECSLCEWRVGGLTYRAAHAQRAAHRCRPR
jgi:hypothetical protein